MLPVNGATVDVEWTLPNGAVRARQATTNAQGLVPFTTLARQSGTYQLCVTNLAKAGYLYDPDQNAETCDTLTVP